MSYNILALHPSHNASIAVVSDGKLVFHIEEERLSRRKYDINPFLSLDYALEKYHIDELIVGGFDPTLHWLSEGFDGGENLFSYYVKKKYPKVKVTILNNNHHLGHAACGFYNSGFDTAVCVVVDGAGSYTRIGNDPKLKDVIAEGQETESIYRCSYPDNIKLVLKKHINGDQPYFYDGVNIFDNSPSIVRSYEAVSKYLGFNPLEGGKTMGLSSYGEDDPNIPNFFYNGYGNDNLVSVTGKYWTEINQLKNPYLRRNAPAETWHRDFSLVTDVEKNLAYRIQTDAEDMLSVLIHNAINITGETNVVISGGFGLNCVANYKYLERFPGINFYIEPVSHDGGTSIGLAKYAWYVHSKSKEKDILETLYWGTTPEYDEHSEIYSNEFESKHVYYDDVVNLINEGNVVAMFQGRSEAGPRALGNRSILFDPRRENGKDEVNHIKKREWFRPFAGSILEEHANEWFDMRGLKSSPFMMYAVNVNIDKIKYIPAIVHVDNTCRIQTVNKNQNPHYYKLIESFYNKTGVPILFNTSFNLAGEPLVETISDALNTLRNSEIKYLYLPEINRLVSKK